MYKKGQRFIVSLEKALAVIRELGMGDLGWSPLSRQEAQIILDQAYQSRELPWMIQIQ